MFEQMAAGHIKACWIICTNPVASVANRKTVIAGLEAAEFVVTQDVFADTETNGYADVVLPGALWTAPGPPPILSLLVSNGMSSSSRTPMSRSGSMPK